MTEEAIRALSVAWHLPELPEKRSPAQQVNGDPAPVAANTKAKAKGRPRKTPCQPKTASFPTGQELQEYQGKESWRGSAGGHKHVVDSELVAKWLNGQCRFDEMRLDPMANQIMNLSSEINRYWVAEHIGLVCEWRRRGRNIEADWACNISLDKQCGFNFVSELPDPGAHNIMLYSDGGLRDLKVEQPELKRAVYGWAIRSTNKVNRDTRLIAMGAEVLDADQAVTVPELEMRGVLKAKEVLLQLTRGTWPETRLSELPFQAIMVEYEKAVGQTPVGQATQQDV